MWLRASRRGYQARSARLLLFAASPVRMLWSAGRSIAAPAQQTSGWNSICMDNVTTRGALMRNRWARTLAFGLVLAGWGTFSPAEAVLKAITYAPLSKVEDSMVIFKKWVEKVNTSGRGDLKIELLGGPEVFSVSDQMNALSKGLVDVVMTFSVHTPVVPEVDTSGLSDITPAEERKNGYLELLDKAHEKMNVKV